MNPSQPVRQCIITLSAVNAAFTSGRLKHAEALLLRAREQLDEALGMMAVQIAEQDEALS